ncbi:hypothetical protein KP509_02G059700 [Ceratopteris richardii]|nr:hypothetical protein KP509_02G059700 [Ceratopteris richardii]
MTVCHLSGAAPANTSTSAGLPSVQENVFLRKIYVGNLPKTTQGDALLEFFSQYGEIEEGPLGFDRETEKCKGFAILIYKSVEAARKCLEEPIKEFGCQQVQCKLADANKIGAHLSSSVLGYNMTNPAAFSSYNPSLIQGNAQSMGQSSLQPGPLPSYGVQGLDPLGIRTSVLLGPDSAYNTSSLSSGVGLGAVPQSSIVHASRGLSSLQPVQNNTTLGQGYNSLPRRLF